MTKAIAVTLGMLMVTLSMAGIGHAQDTATIQGTIQAVDCNTKALDVRATDGAQYRMYVVPASTTVFVNSNPVSFCALQQYIGSTVTVSLVPNGNQLMVKRVNVSTTATPTSAQNPPSGAAVNGIPDWAKIALGIVLVGALIYIGSRPHDPPQNQPYSLCRDGTYRQSCP